MVSSVNSTTAAQTTGKTSSSGTSSTYSDTYNTFLQVLCTELQTQNPLNPTDTTQYISQLTSLSSLEQQIGTNDKLDQVLNQFDTLTLSNGTGYIGYNVEAKGDTVSVGDDGTVSATWKYSLDSAAKDVKLSVVDANGNTVWTGTGDATTGTHDFKWDGKDYDGNAVSGGNYTLKVAATNNAGKDLDASISILGKVTAVDSSNGKTILELGDTQVNMSSVTRLAA